MLTAACSCVLDLPRANTMPELPEAQGSTQATMTVAGHSTVELVKWAKEAAAKIETKQNTHHTYANPKGCLKPITAHTSCRHCDQAREEETLERKVKRQGVLVPRLHNGHSHPTSNHHHYLTLY